MSTVMIKPVKLKFNPKIYNKHIFSEKILEYSMNNLTMP